MTCEFKNLSINVSRLPTNIFNITRRDGSIPVHVLNAYLSEKDSSSMQKPMTRLQANMHRFPTTPSPSRRRTRSSTDLSEDRRPKRSRLTDSGRPTPKRRRLRSTRAETATPVTAGEEEWRCKKLLSRLDCSEAVNSTVDSDSSSSKRWTMNSAQRSKTDSSSNNNNQLCEEETETQLKRKKTRQGRSPLAPLGCECPAMEDTPRSRLPSSPRCASSPVESVPVTTAPKKRRQRFRLLRSKKVEWDESASQTTLDLDQSPLVRSGCKSRLVSCRQLVLDKAKQSQPVSWSDYLSGMAKENFVFLGEGDFAEVYRYSVGKQSVVMKVMAAVDDEDQIAPAEVKGYSHYLPEIVASKMMTRLSFKFHSNRTHGFAKLIGINVVKGRLPRMLTELKTSNGYPTSDSHHLPAHQEWLVLKYPYLGKSLDSIPLLELPAAAMRSIVAQVAISLAVGELVFKFEHRDLHLANVLLHKVRFDRFRYRVDNENLSVPSEGYLATIIDYTLARVTDEDGEVYFVDFEDDEQDSSQELPEHLSVHFKTKEMNGNQWDVFNPYSNILWLKYMCEKFRDALNALPMGERMRKRNDHAHRAIHSELTVLIDSMSGFTSCAELVRHNFFFDAFRISGGD